MVPAGTGGKAVTLFAVGSKTKASPGLKLKPISLFSLTSTRLAPVGTTRSGWMKTGALGLDCHVFPTGLKISAMPVIEAAHDIPPKQPVPPIRTSRPFSHVEVALPVKTLAGGEGSRRHEL